MDEWALGSLINAVERYRLAKANMPDGFCGMCELARIRGNGDYCQDHETAGVEFDEAVYVVLCAAEHFVDNR